MTIDLNWIAQNFPELTAITALRDGGQKWVFAAQHPTDGNVVLKIIKPGTDPETVRREIIAVQKVQCPRVPRIHEANTVSTVLGPCFWFREERVGGECLRDTLSRGPLPPRETLLLGSQMLEVLAASTQVQLVHRDVKPENIIRDSNGDFWLLDFGLARHLDLASMTADHLPWGKGTCGYSAPEQIRNQKAMIDERADLFALGVTIYECATGANPFVAGTGPFDHAERIRRAENDPLPRVTLAISKQADFADLIAAMTQKRRDQRPHTVVEALQWMREICAAEGVP